jgi:hypothetical protein
LLRRRSSSFAGGTLRQSKKGGQNILPAFFICPKSKNQPLQSRGWFDA